MDRTSRPTHAGAPARVAPRRRLTGALLPLLLVAAPGAEVPAQRAADARAAPAPPIGWTVRLTLRPDGRVRQGRLQSLDSAAVTLRPPGRGSAAFTVAVTQLDSLEVYRGRAGRARTLAGAAGGALLVGGVFALLHRSLERDEEDCVIVCHPPVFLKPLFHPAVGAMIGAGAGGIVAYQTAPERWERVRLP